MTSTSRRRRSSASVTGGRATATASHDDGVRGRRPERARSPSRDRGRLVAAELGEQLERHRRADVDPPGAVGDADALEVDHPSVVGGDLAEPDELVEGGDRALHQGTILLIGSSRMAVAPASLRAGMSVLIVRFSTTDSTAYPPSANWATVGEPAEGSTASKFSYATAATLSFTSTFPRASIVPVSSVISWSIAWRLS